MANVSNQDLPNDVESVIFQKLPVKSLLRCKPASKSHNDMIESRYFIEEHHKFMKDKLLLRLPDEKSVDDEAMPVLASTYALYDDEALTSYTMPIEFQVPDDPEFWTVVGVSKGVMCMAAHLLGRVVLLNPATRRMSTLPTYDSLLPWRQEEDDCRLEDVVFGFSLDFNRGFNIMALGYYKYGINNKSYYRACVCSSPVMPDGEWRWSPIGDSLPEVTSEGDLDTSKGAEFLDGVYYWLVEKKGFSVFVMSFNTWHERFGATAEVKGCFALAPETVTTHVSLAVCMDELAMVWIGWESVGQFIEIWRPRAEGWSKTERINIVNFKTRICYVIPYTPNHLLLQLRNTEGMPVFCLSNAAWTETATVELNERDLKPISLRPATFTSRPPQQLFVYRESLVRLPDEVAWDPSDDTRFK